MLLFGTNASGKSSLMKAVGLNIILAQSGFFVPCKAMAYKPYHNLFTRINNNDNIFKGESSFAVEMSELRNILKRSKHKNIKISQINSLFLIKHSKFIVHHGVSMMDPKTIIFNKPNIILCYPALSFHYFPLLLVE